MADSAPLLRLSNIVKQYPSVTANDHVDLEVEAGQIHAVLGENGAGKSTLMKIVYGVTQPDQGQIEWQGDAVAIKSPAQARAMGIGMVFQHFSLFETLSVVENISLSVQGTMAELATRIKDASTRFGLDVDPYATVHSLTVGERQRIEILRCILQEPRLLIMDEPTSVLPPQGITRLFETLRNLAATGIGIIFISHKLEEIRALCDVATVMRAGRVVGVVDPRKETAKTLTRLMIGHEIALPERAESTDKSIPVLSINGLSLTPPDPQQSALNEINMTLSSGQIIGIAGVSGNGQGLLTRVLSGEEILSAENAGLIRMDDRPIGQMNPDQRRRLGLHFVPEERLGRGAVPLHSLTENTGLTASHAGLSRWGFLKLRSRNLLTSSIIDAMDVRCGGVDATAQSLSGGNLQKFIMGRELALTPRVLIVAQPTWGVDVSAAAAIRQKLLDLRAKGAAILVISEELEELFEICDQLHVMFRGRLSRPVRASQTDMDSIGLAMAGDFAQVEATVSDTLSETLSGSGSGNGSGNVSSGELHG